MNGKARKYYLLVLLLIVILSVFTMLILPIKRQNETHDDKEAHESSFTNETFSSDKHMAIDDLFTVSSNIVYGRVQQVISTSNSQCTYNTIELNVLKTYGANELTYTYPSINVITFVYVVEPDCNLQKDDECIVALSKINSYEMQILLGSKSKEKYIVAEPSYGLIFVKDNQCVAGNFMRAASPDVYHSDNEYYTMDEVEDAISKHIDKIKSHSPLELVP